MYEFQVVCPSCQVTFPVEQKRCVHCGGPLLSGDAAPVIRQDVPRSLEPELAPEEVSEEVSVPKPGASLRRALFAVWLLMALGGSLMRSCGF